LSTCKTQHACNGPSACAPLWDNARNTKTVRAHRCGRRAERRAEAERGSLSRGKGALVRRWTCVRRRRTLRIVSASRPNALPPTAAGGIWAEPFMAVRSVACFTRSP
jgi:hypothetical protein